MGVVAKRFAEGTALTATSAVIYTVPSTVPASVAVIKAATVYNSTAGAVTVNINLVATGGSATTVNRVIARSIAAGETYRCLEIVNHVLAAGGTVRALGDGLSFALSGVEIN